MTAVADKLPIEHGLSGSLRIYVTRLAVVLGVVAANLALIEMLWLRTLVQRLDTVLLLMAVFMFGVIVHRLIVNAGLRSHRVVRERELLQRCRELESLIATLRLSDQLESRSLERAMIPRSMQGREVSEHERAFVELPLEDQLEELARQLEPVLEEMISFSHNLEETEQYAGGRNAQEAAAALRAATINLRNASQIMRKLRSGVARPSPIRRE